MDIYKNPTVELLAVMLLQDVKKTLVEELTPYGRDTKVAIIVVPYGAGDPVNYRGVASELFEIYSECAFYCINIPRQELHINEKEQTVAEMQVILENMKTEVDDLVSKVVSEIKSKIHVPVMVYSKCVGAGLGLELVNRLEEEGIDLIAQCVAGAMATLKMPPLEKVFVSDLEKLSSLRSMGATVPELDEDQRIFSKHVRWDIALGVASFNSMLRKLNNKKLKKLATPLYCICGTEDPTTPDFRYKYNDWGFYAEKVELIVIQNVGHYFSRDNPNQLAHILHKIIIGQQDNICEKPDKSIGFRIKSVLHNL